METPLHSVRVIVCGFFSLFSLLPFFAVHVGHCSSDRCFVLRSIWLMRHDLGAKWLNFMSDGFSCWFLIDLDRMAWWYRVGFSKGRPFRKLFRIDCGQRLTSQDILLHFENTLTRLANRLFQLKSLTSLCQFLQTLLTILRIPEWIFPSKNNVLNVPELSNSFSSKK